MDQPNIFLIVFDTLRKDVLPVYGGDAIAPNLTEFSKDAVVFNNAISPSPWTVPSHFSFFTGLYAREHNVYEDFRTGDREIFEKMSNFTGETITKKLYDLGYNTIAYSANPWLSPYSGFDRYFRFFNFQDPIYFNDFERQLAEELKKYGNNKIKAAMNLTLKLKIKEIQNFYLAYKSIHGRINPYPISKGADRIIDNIVNSSYEEPFFIFINLMEVHEPTAKWELKEDDRKIKYLDVTGIKTLNNNELNKIKYGYKQSLKFLDEQFGKLIKYLKKQKIYDESLIILLSDHGQSLKDEHKFSYYGHGNFLYDEIIEVPLIVKFPKNSKYEIKKGYQSLTSIPKIIQNVAEGENYTDITEEIAYSETFGPIHDLNELVKTGVLPNNININEIIKNIFYPKKQFI
jgi:arylsulfatase A-like enzyme